MGIVLTNLVEKKDNNGSFSLLEATLVPGNEPHAFVIRSPRLRVLILYTPGGLEEGFNKMSSPPQNLEPPTEALTYSQSDLEQTARRFGEYGVQILSPEEVAGNCPYLKNRFHAPGRPI